MILSSNQPKHELFMKKLHDIVLKLDSECSARKNDIVLTTCSYWQIREIQIGFCLANWIQNVIVLKLDTETYQKSAKQLYY